MDWKCDTDDEDEEWKVLDYVVKRVVGSFGTLEKQCVRGSL